VSPEGRLSTEESNVGGGNEENEIEAGDAAVGRDDRKNRKNFENQVKLKERGRGALGKRRKSPF